MFLRSLITSSSWFTAVNRSRICMVGDRLDTDVLFGANNGLMSILTLRLVWVGGCDEWVPSWGRYFLFSFEPHFIMLSVQATA